jgi:hypothetical protein
LAKDRSLPDPASHLKIGSHQRVIGQLKSSQTIASGKKLAYILEDMKRQRVVADYQLSDRLHKQAAFMQLKTAQRFEQEINNLA